MPFIHVELLEGRSPQAKEAMAKEIIEVVSKHSGAPTERIHVVFQDMKKENYFHNPKSTGRLAEVIPQPFPLAN